MDGDLKTHCFKGVDKAGMQFYCTLLPTPTEMHTRGWKCCGHRVRCPKPQMVEWNKGQTGDVDPAVESLHRPPLDGHLALAHWHVTRGISHLARPVSSVILLQVSSAVLTQKATAAKAFMRLPRRWQLRREGHVVLQVGVPQHLMAEETEAKTTGETKEKQPQR